MTTLTIVDLPRSRALDYKAMAAIRGAGSTGDWCLFAFQPFIPARAIGSCRPSTFSDQLLRRPVESDNTNIDVKIRAAPSISIPRRTH